jgi:sulfite exporter TauE/SafE
LLLVQGLLAAGVLPARVKASPHPCLTGSAFATLLTSPNVSSVFVAGLLTGLLPCGLVYAYLALAASTGRMTTAAALMSLFGAGTAPVMVFTGYSGFLLSLASRRRLLRFAAWCVVATGFISLGRGAVVLYHLRASDPPAACPLCNDPTASPVAH